MSRVVNPVEVNGKWYHFGLPSEWVYVVYENGEEINVANQDWLTRAEAEEYAKMWTGKRGKVVEVILKDSRDNERYRYKIG